MDKKILSADIKNISWIRSERSMCDSSHEFACEIGGEKLALYHELYRHDDGYGFTIHTKPEDIWERMDATELEKLDSILEKVRNFGTYLKKISEAEDPDALDIIKWELVEMGASEMTEEHWEKIGEAFEKKTEEFEKEKRS